MDTSTKNNRSLTEEEFDKFFGSHDHTNYNESYCCPHCMTSTTADNFYSSGGTPAVLICSEPACGKEFVIWQDVETVFRSAKLES